MIKCEKCGSIMWKAPVVLTSNPVKFEYHCPYCDNMIYSYINDSSHVIRNATQWEQLQKEAQENKEKLPMDKVAYHKDLCLQLNDLYARKNADYGDSFHISYEQEGMAMPRIRLGDKYNRFCALTRGNKQQVNDESIRDTLIDLANYALMTVLEIDAEQDKIS